MSQAEPKQATSKSRFPWILCLLLLGGIYVFWLLPIQLGPRNVQVQFETQK